jgi:hypothetical protein
LRYINYSFVDERATIGDPHHRGAPVLLIADVDQRPEWQRPMRGDKILGERVFSARRLFAQE